MLIGLRRLGVVPDAILHADTGDEHPLTNAYRRYRHGPGAFKVDLAVAGGVPWTNEAARRAGTVHASGSFAEIVAAERLVNRGRMPERPFVLVCQQSLADPTRSRDDVHPVWAYAHVPSGYTGDATEALLDQIERFAPGLRERVVGKAVRTTGEIERDNANYVGVRLRRARWRLFAGRSRTWRIDSSPIWLPRGAATSSPGRIPHGRP